MHIAPLTIKHENKISTTQNKMESSTLNIKIKDRIPLKSIKPRLYSNLAYKQSE